MSDDEKAKLDALADADRRKASDWIRLAIIDAYAERFGTDEVPPPKKPKR